jgi:hypothetical protein
MNVGRKGAELVAIPHDAGDEDRAALRRAWAEIDALEARLRAARTAIRAIEHRVSDAHGYRTRLTRHQLERLLGAR